MRILLFISLCLASDIALAQLDAKTITGENRSLPWFDIHVGAGLAQGGRVGGRIQISEHISTELSAGSDIWNFVSASDIEHRYSFGINFHPSMTSEVAFGILFITRTRPYHIPKNMFEDGYLSLHAGWLSLKQKGLGLFFRGGGTFRLYNSEPLLVRSGLGVLNLDIGLHYVF